MRLRYVISERAALAHVNEPEQNLIAHGGKREIVGEDESGFFGGETHEKHVDVWFI